MQTLGAIQADDLAVTMISVIAVLAFYALHCVKNEKEHNLKVVVTIMIVVSLVVLSSQKYSNSSEKSRVLNRFNSAEDIVCKLNEDSNIVISKKRGYELKSNFFIKDDIAVELGKCYLLK